MTREQRRNQICLMRQELLAHRFKLKVHFETRVMPIYELMVAKGGPKLTPRNEPPPVPNTPPLGLSNPPEEVPQGIRVIRKTQTITEMTVKGEPMNAWVPMPFLGLDRPVVDKTGLSGKYDFTLSWTQDSSASRESGGLAAPGDSDGPSLFTVMQGAAWVEAGANEGVGRSHHHRPYRTTLRELRVGTAPNNVVPVKSAPPFASSPGQRV
jgi:uncharacterized protein (TIGR03435 family)